MKKIIKPLIITACATLLVMPLSGCWGNSESASQAPAPAPAPKQATNVELIEVPGFNRILVFDIERDGLTLTCTSKAGYDSGVSCLPKVKQ